MIENIKHLAKQVCLPNESFRLLDLIQVTGCLSITNLNDFLSSKMIFEQKLSITADCTIKQIDSKDFLSQFETLCQNIIKLLSQQIPVNIKTIFGIFGNEDQVIYDSTVNSIFSLHFDRQKSSNKYMMVSFDSYHGHPSFMSPRVKNKYVMKCQTFTLLKSDDYN